MRQCLHGIELPTNREGQLRPINPGPPDRLLMGRPPSFKISLARAARTPQKPPASGHVDQRPCVASSHPRASSPGSPTRTPAPNWANPLREPGYDLSFPVLLHMMVEVSKSRLLTRALISPRARAHSGLDPPPPHVSKKISTLQRDCHLQGASATAPITPR
jgi:hypothetical protein